MVASKITLLLFSSNAEDEVNFQRKGSSVLFEFFCISNRVDSAFYLQDNTVLCKCEKNFNMTSPPFLYNITLISILSEINRSAVFAARILF